MNIGKKPYLMRKLLTLAGCLLITACAAPKYTGDAPEKTAYDAEQNRQFKAAFAYQDQQRLRLAEIGQQLFVGVRDVCGQKNRAHLGIRLHQPADYPQEQRTAATEFYGLENGVQIKTVLRHSAAAGKLQAEDQLLRINEQPVPESTSATTKLLREQLKQSATITLEINRQQQSKSITLTAIEQCDYPLFLSQSDAINGYADGSSIVITAGLMRFAKEDNQLALIIAHELAHNVEQHIPQRLQNAALGGLVDIALISSGVFSPFIGSGLAANLHTQDYELEADLIGLQYLHMAGFEITGLDRFWRQMAALHPSTITHGKVASHPTTVERVLRLQQEIKKLSNKSD